MAEMTAAPVQSRIRPDLWRAVLDFSGDEKYVWDQSGRVARRTSDAADPGPDMPTITAEQFTAWKRAFAEGVDGNDRDERLDEWTERRLPASFLPPHLKHRWNGHLKDEVHRRLASWFEAQNLTPPGDLLVVRDSSEPHTGPDLRQRLIACLRVMSPDELERVQIPASVLLRLKP